MFLGNDRSEKKSRYDPRYIAMVVLFVAGGACMFGAFSLTMDALPMYVRALGSLKWPSCEGMVVASAGPSQRRAGYPHIFCYSYTVGGTNYAGTRKTFF